MITSSKALVESSTFCAKRVVSLLSSTSISARRVLPAASRSAPWRRKLSMVLVRKRRRTPARAAASSVAAYSRSAFHRPSCKGMPRVELAGQRLDGVVGGAQLRIGGHALQVPDHAHGVVQPLGQRVQGRSVFSKVRALAAAPPGRRACARASSEQSPDRGLDVLGADPVEGNAELDRKQGVVRMGFWHGFTQYKLLESAPGGAT